MTSAAGPAPLEMWGGVECTVNRVGDRWFDQLARTGHDRRFHDLERCASLGIRALRYPLLWERLAPLGVEHIDWRWSDARLAYLREHGIRPIVGLVHHGSGPAGTSLLDDGFADGLAVFAAAVARRYPWVEDYTPINEPLTTARFSGLYGHWYPHGTDDRSFARALLIETRATVNAMRVIREVSPGARLIQTEDCGAAFGTEHTDEQAAFERERRWLTTDLLTGRVTPQHPMHGWLLHSGIARAELGAVVDDPCPPAIIGLNYYLTSDRFLDERLDRHPAWSHGGNGRIAYADVEAVRSRPGGIVGHEAHLLEAWERYGLPVAITEAHLACTREEQLRWLLEAWRGAEAARARGADVRAVTAWALFGSFDWDSLVTREAGVYEPGVFNLRAPSPRSTALVPLIRSLASGDQPVHPVLASPGWWRRSTSLPSVAAPPLLLVGAGEPLATAVAEACRGRGLAVVTVARGDVDAGERGVAAVVSRLAPWAVIDAREDADADAAERDPDRSRQTHMEVPARLAAACRGRGMPLLAFSSDQVFDGLQRRAYTEDDAVSPRNVLGASKSEAERRILAACPQALVVRTGPMFGFAAGDRFITAGLRAIQDGREWRAAGDTSISPTYVPHLIGAALDLLIDGESGLWHLANAGAVTWWELACEAARRAGLGQERIVRVHATDVWGPATRPRWSVLSSQRGSLMPPLDAALATYFENGKPTRGVEACAAP